MVYKSIKLPFKALIESHNVEGVLFYALSYANKAPSTLCGSIIDFN